MPKHSARRHGHGVEMNRDIVTVRQQGQYWLIGDDVPNAPMGPFNTEDEVGKAIKRIMLDDQQKATRDE